MIAFYKKYKKGVHAQVVLLLVWFIALPSGPVHKAQWAALALSLLGGPAVAATSNEP